MKNKLTNQKGESIAEALIALLIVALGIVVVATMIATSTRIVNHGNKRLQTIYTLTNNLEQNSGDTINTQHESLNIGLDGDQSTIDIITTQSKTDSLSIYSYEIQQKNN